MDPAPSEAASLVPPIAGAAASLGGAAPPPSMAGTGGIAGTSPPLREPCVRNDVKPCACEGTDVQGQQLCLYDMASPMGGFFSECRGCPAPEPVDMPDPEPVPSCTDAMQNGSETGTDCGGPDCAPCSPPAGGTGGTGGMGGTSGTGGASGTSAPDAGEDDPPIDEPVSDCDGVPEGTECDRTCILPFNVARCNARGNCSCL